jgi:phage-related protein
MAITSAIGDLFASFYELIASVFNGIYNIIHTAISIVVGFFTGIFNLIAGVIKETLHATGSTGKFVLHNADKAVWILIGVGAAVAITRYTATGQRAAAGKAPVKRG